MTSLADVVLSDPVELTGNPEAVKAALTEAVTATDDKTSASGTAPPSGDKAADKLPEKFRGKSVEDVVEMYQNLESRYGTMANDLGVQRQLTDRLLDLKRDTDLRRNSPPAERKPVEVTSTDLLDNPTATLERVVDARAQAVTEDVNARLARMEQSLAQQTFTARHPDFQTVVKDAEFEGWVKASPIRMRAAAEANRGNWQIADELLSEYKTSKGSSARKTDETTNDSSGKGDLAAARAASLTASGSSSGSDGRSNGGKKIYRRRDLMQLRINDPDSYYDDAFQAEIMAAHAEGRVK